MAHYKKPNRRSIPRFVITHLLQRHCYKGRKNGPSAPQMGRHFGGAPEIPDDVHFRNVSLIIKTVTELLSG